MEKTPLQNLVDSHTTILIKRFLVATGSRKRTPADIMLLLMMALEQAWLDFTDESQVEYIVTQSIYKALGLLPFSEPERAQVVLAFQTIETTYFEEIMALYNGQYRFRNAETVEELPKRKGWCCVKISLQ